MQTEWTFPSSSSNAIYTTKRNADGSLSCNCKGWTFKRGDAPRECKHTRQVAAQFAAPARAPFSAKPAAPAPARTPSAAKPARTVPAPMLASAMTIPATGAAFDRAYRGWLMEEKHDGHRVGIATEAGRTITAWSRPRAGEEPNARELPAAMLEALAHFSPGIYDGELVVPGGNSWDVTAIGRSYEHRRDMLLDQLAKLPDGQKSVTTVESHPASWARVEAIWKRGGEGAILKRPESTYRPGHRSPEWVKVKAKNAATLTVIGYEDGKSGPHSKLKLRDASGHETTVKTLGNAMLREIESNPRKWVGRRVVISYQQKTPGGSYRHGIFDHWAGEGE